MRYSHTLIDNKERLNILSMHKILYCIILYTSRYLRYNNVRYAYDCMIYDNKSTNRRKGKKKNPIYLRLLNKKKQFDMTNGWRAALGPSFRNGFCDFGLCTNNIVFIYLFPKRKGFEAGRRNTDLGFPPLFPSIYRRPGRASGTLYRAARLKAGQNETK